MQKYRWESRVNVTYPRKQRQGEGAKRDRKRATESGDISRKRNGQLLKKTPRKHPSKFPILRKEGQDVNVFRKEMGEEMQWEMATSQREDPLFVFHERPSDNGN